MAATTHTPARIAVRPRPDRARATDQRRPRRAATPESQDRPTDTQVWNWAESAALAGHGPSARDFL
ncbi:hypothetical protein M2161_008556 [Streptomyces sp. SAI-133]|uniref:hypothetical protein n=1 Tax=unclassified Streptomyces TaxID=2593676 RepID=UPI002476E5B8|nr:hypothetical protein [Streptomyces sp. SAI-133]MDH6589450.1 hypothetical protein [Streptomyces sp. SAI-133]